MVNKEPVNHPNHYGGDNPHEVIKCLEDWEKRNPVVMDLNVGQALIYIARAGIKDPEKLIEDLEKAVWWLQRYINKHKSKK